MHGRNANEIQHESIILPNTNSQTYTLLCNKGLGTELCNEFIIHHHTQQQKEMYQMLTIGNFESLNFSHIFKFAFLMIGKSVKCDKATAL